MNRSSRYPGVHDANPADVLRALADPTRRRIVESLLDGPQSVTAMAERLNVQQYDTSKHLAILLKTRIVDRIAQGKLRIYSIVPELLIGLRKTDPQLDFGWAEFSINGFIRHTKGVSEERGGETTSRPIGRKD